MGHLSACTPTGSEKTRIIARLIEPGDYTSSEAAVFYDTVEVEKWAFNRDEDLSGWTPERIDTSFEIDKDGLLVESSSEDPSIFREVKLEAARVKAIRVTQSGLTSDAYMQLFWAPTGEAFNETRSIGCSTQDVTGALIPS